MNKIELEKEIQFLEELGAMELTFHCGAERLRILEGKKKTLAEMAKKEKFCTYCAEDEEDCCCHSNNQNLISYKEADEKNKFAEYCEREAMKMGE